MQNSGHVLLHRGGSDVNKAQMMARLESMKARRGAAYSDRDIEALEIEIHDRFGTMEPDAWLQLAKDTLANEFESRFGDFDPAQVERTATDVARQWKERGREIEMTADGARAIAYEVGNRIYYDKVGGSYDPAQAGGQREPQTGLFGSRTPAKDDE
jgi:hypothetical protein